MATITKIGQNIPIVKARKKVAAYARVSMESEALSRSLSAQISYYSDLIQKNPEWEYAGVYADRFVSGTSTKHRDEFKRMIKDCEEGKIDIILCKSISRMARNTVDLLEAVRHLKDIGVEIRFEKENINSLSGDGELMLSILASFAQEESHSISENQKWSIQKGFQKGKVRHVRTLGYDIADGQFVIVPKEAETVRRIFDLYIGGMSCCKIAETLNDEGIKSCKGGTFSCTVISAILRNEKYTGNALLQKYYSTGAGSTRVKQNKGQLPMYYVENAHEAIISQETFDAAQREKARRYGVEIKNGTAETASYFYNHMWTDETRKHFSELRKASAERYPKYELSAFIKCERCGEYLRAQKLYHSDGSQNINWVCGHHYHNKDRVFLDIPKAMNMLDDVLKSIISEVLGMKKFDADIMREKLTYISATADNLTFHFTDGHTEKRQYTKER